MKHLSKETRVILVIIIALAFFATEIAIGFRNHSLALVADAFHLFSDLLGYVVALVAIRMAKTPDKNINPKYSFGYQRAELIGGFFNGAFLMALGVSILLQSIERFIKPEEVLDPVLVLAIGAAGVGSNILMAIIVGHDHGGHAHSHGPPADTVIVNASSIAGPSALTASRNHYHTHEGHAHLEYTNRGTKGHHHGHDLNILGIFIHILGDALNSVAVIISAGVFMATKFVYADPIASTFVGIMIICTALPLVLRCGRFLLETAPENIDIAGVLEDIERVVGKDSVHELHVWNITQRKTLASLHLSVQDSIENFIIAAEKVRECLHFWGIHIATIQPEFKPNALSTSTPLEIQPFVIDEGPMISSTPPKDKVATFPPAELIRRVSCRIKCSPSCGDDICCESEMDG